jgi:hypothetical protein
MLSQCEAKCFSASEAGNGECGHWQWLSFLMLLAKHKLQDMLSKQAL